MKYYLEKHKNQMYISEDFPADGLSLYQSQKGWLDLYVGEHLIFSHRLNNYKSPDFPERLHKHLFYEIDIFKKGEVSYIVDEHEVFPVRGDIIIFPPGCDHTAHLIKECFYERHILYFSGDFFLKSNIKKPPSFLSSNKACVRRISSNKNTRFAELLNELSSMSEKQNKADAVLANALCFELIHLIVNYSKISDIDVTPIPDYVRRVREYIDNNFTTIQSVTELAKDLYYSREYMSRIFKQYYNLSVSEYLIRKKIDYAAELLKNGKSVSFACDSSGFHSMSAFIRSFRAIKGVLPSKLKD